MLRPLVVSCLLASGCATSASTHLTANTQMDGLGDDQADTQVSAQGSVDGKEATSTRPGESEATSNAFIDEDAAPEVSALARPLLGARAGLHLAKVETETCHCLAVAAGLPSDPRLRWDGRVSEIDATSQLVIALSSNGIACPDAPKSSLGASYRGYQMEGSDVVVLVETGRNGRPLAEGAVVPRPPTGGRLIIRPMDGQTPYGRPLDNKSAKCVVTATP